MRPDREPIPAKPLVTEVCLSTLLSTKSVVSILHYKNGTAHHMHHTLFYVRGTAREGPDPRIMISWLSRP